IFSRNKKYSMNRYKGIFHTIEQSNLMKWVQIQQEEQWKISRPRGDDKVSTMPVDQALKLLCPKWNEGDETPSMEEIEAVNSFILKYVLINERGLKNKWR